MTQRDDDFTAFVTARSGSLLRLAYVLTGHRTDAEDLLQVALAKAYVAWPRIRSANAVESYVRTCLVRAHFSHRRRRRVTQVPLSIEPADNKSADSLSAVDDRDALWAALQALPPRQRTVLVLKFFEDLDEASIAELMRTSRGTVKSQTSKALKTLQGSHHLYSTDQSRPRR